MPTYEQIHELEKQLWGKIYTRWVNVELFSIPWLFQMGLTIAAYVIWIKILDKKRLKELLLIGSFVAVAFGFYDVMATTIRLWGYRVRVLPGVPSMFANDYTLAPIMVMIAAQFGATWKKYSFWAIGMSAIYAFIIIPVSTWVGVLEFHMWNHFYTFLLILFTAMVVRCIYLWVDRIEESSKK
jgi:hypothetical protein